MNFDKLQFEQWNKLRVEKKEEILKLLENYKGHNFKLQYIDTFGDGKESFETGVFDLDGSEFLFIPGKTTKIGYNPEEKDDNVRNLVEEELEKYFNNPYSELECKYKTISDFYKFYMSPLREITISPMLVERDKIEVRSHECLDECCCKEHDHHMDFAIKYIAEENKLYIHGEYTIDDIKRCIKEANFSFVCEDEWEYLSGGECNNIFCDEEYKNIKEANENDEDYYEEDPFTNKFGIFINYNKMETELVDSPCQCKGSDFGDVISSDYRWVDNLQYSPHYRPQQHQKENVEMAEHFDTYVRRVVRIDDINKNTNGNMI